MSMIQQLKNNMMGGQQPAPQQLNPQQQQMVQGLQKQKQELQNNYNSASKGASFFSGASQGMVDAPKGESFLASLARGINSGTNNMENLRVSQEKNLEKQSAIDAAIAQTYQFVEDYNYKRSMDKERLDIEREKIGAIREGHQVAREGHELTLQGKQVDAAQKQNKENNTNLKPFQQRNSAARKTYNEIELAKEQLKSMKKWGPVQGLLSDVGGHNALAQISGNDATDLKVLDKRLSTILTYMMEEHRNGRMTNDLMKLFGKTKPDIAMGYDGIERVLNDLEKKAVDDMNRSEFVIKAVQTGANMFDAEQLYDKDPSEAMAMLRGKPQPKEEKRPEKTQIPSGGQEQQKDPNIFINKDDDLLNKATNSLLGE